jgi:hypothetical protein
MLLEPAPNVSRQQQLLVRVQQLEHHVLQEVLHQEQLQLLKRQQLKALQLLTPHQAARQLQ